MIVSRRTAAYATPNRTRLNVTTLERMFILILLFLLGGVAEDPHPFPRGVVLVNPDGSTQGVLPGPLSWGALFRRR